MKQNDAVASATSPGMSTLPAFILATLPAVILLVAAVLTMSVLLPMSAVAAGEIRCATCGKPIVEGQWVEVDGRTYHAEHFCCAHCGKPIDIAAPFFVSDGRYYDSTCFANQVTSRCDYCGLPVLAEYFSTDTAIYHSACYYDHVAKKCVVCGVPILGEYFFDGFGNAVCALHKSGVKQCHACGRMLSGSGSDAYRYADGRLMCGLCVSTAVVDEGEAADIMDSIRAVLREEGIDLGKRKIKLRLVSQQELMRQAHEFEEDRLGVTLYEKESFFGGIISRKDFRIFILHGLPACLYRAVVAHELMHVWLFANGPDAQDRRMCEGSCEYASYLVLAQDQSSEGPFYLKKLRENPDPIYGDGFRRVRDAVTSGGWDEWLTYLRKNSRPPW